MYNTSPTPGSIPLGHVRLVLMRKPIFYLDIPLTIIRSLSHKPRKYLVYLGWSILGVEGGLAGCDDTQHMELEGDLNDEGLYYYVTSGVDPDLSRAIDPDVIKYQASLASTSSDSRLNFREELLQRDICCIFTGTKEAYGVGMHIIPYARGSDCLRMIIGYRPKYDEELEELEDINDIRNGVFVFDCIHQQFDRRELAILKTPNIVLTTADVPPRVQRRWPLPEDGTYPVDERYTLQWLGTPDEDDLSLIPNNADAAFKTDTEQPKPSDLLLHYTYAGAAVHQWGHGVEVLQGRHILPDPTGPRRTRNDQSTVIKKDNATQEKWNADDIVLFFWANTPAARERRRKEQEEHDQRMEAWRRGVQ